MSGSETIADASSGTPPPLEPELWMLGVFSGGEPQLGDSDHITRYYVHADMTMAEVSVDSHAILSQRERTWEVHSETEYWIFPSDDDGSPPDYWRVTRALPCGPHELLGLRDGQPWGPTLRMNPGELCVEPLPPPCVDPDDPTTCGEQSFNYFWCEEPPPCEENDD